MADSNEYRSCRIFLVTCRLWMIIFQIIWLSVFLVVGRLPDYDEWVSNIYVYLLSNAGGFCILIVMPIVLWGLFLLGVCVVNRNRQKEPTSRKLKMIGFGMVLVATGSALPLALSEIGRDPLSLRARLVVMLLVTAFDAILLISTGKLLRKTCSETM